MTDTIEVNKEVQTLISGKQAWHYEVFPYNAENGNISFYTTGNTNDQNLKEELEFITGKKVSFRKTDSDLLTALLEKYYPNEHPDSRQQNEYYHGEADNFLTHLIREARGLKSSDIHLEIFEGKCRVRLRIDGMLIQRYLIDKKQYPSLINKIKIVSNLDIAEKRLPQDGRIFFELENDKFDIRVSVLPTLYGEKIVLRLLNNDATNININTLGFSDFDLQNYLEGVKKPNGIILISGPTGSGKTTTLYATLKLLNKETRNILTIEDPIEYTLEGVNQVQLKENIGFSFAAALRTFLRQDPDVIMLGEIRDTETANMAIRAALTGHLVLSTIHTNSAWGIVSRLIDMGVAPYLLAHTLNTAIAQRLIRLLCPHCKIKTGLKNEIYPKNFLPYKMLDFHFVPKGCNDCFNTGYKGRKAVYEVIPIDNELSEQVKNSNYNVNEIIHKKGVKFLSENAFRLFSEGQTSMEEIYPLLMT
jgi:general secretion pathway protein E/type IV pilus assembly protein PilB